MIPDPVESIGCGCSRCARGQLGPPPGAASGEQPFLAAIADAAAAIAELAADVRRAEGALVLGIRRLHQASGRREGLWWTDAVDALDAAPAARAEPGRARRDVA